MVVTGFMINISLYAGSYSGGDGLTPETAYLMACTADLIELSNSPADWNSYFLQTADIIFEEDETLVDWDGDGILEHPGDDALGFSSIGNANHKFTGSYNGQNFTISDLYISQNLGIYIGLFGWVNGTGGAVIENIILENVDFTAQRYIGGLTGINMVCTVTNCTVSGNIFASDDYVGGLIGYATGSSYISNCHTSCEIQGHALAGGLIGFIQSDGVVLNCSSSCIVDAIEGEAGGLIGHNVGHVDNCFALGSVNGAYLSGGLIGINKGIVNNCYAETTTSGTIIIGGLIGSNETGVINKCFANGTVEGDFYTGGLIGDNNSGVVFSSFWDIETSGQNMSGGGTGKTSLEIKSIQTYTDTETEGLTETWDFIGYPFDDSGTGDHWNIADENINNGYPYFSWQDSTSTPIVITVEASNITCSEADLGGKVTKDGGSPVIGRGIVYSLTNSEPLIGDEDVYDEEIGNGTGNFVETITGLQSETKYYFRAYASNLLGISYAQVISFNTKMETVIWEGHENENWNNPANWSTGTVPQPPDNVSIPSLSGMTPNPVIGPPQTADCNNLSIAPGGKLTIQSNENGSGSLITKGVVEIDGTFEIQKYIQDSALHFISVPLLDQIAEPFLGDYLLQWTEQTHLWSNIVDPNTELSQFSGYGLQQLTGSPKIYTFQGIPCSGSLSHAISFTEYSDDPDANEGANLLGNPYPSSIDWSKLDDIWGAVYFWNAEAQCYASWNNGQATNGGSQFIPPMQGFFIVASAPGTINFEDSLRTHEGASAFYKSDTALSPNSLMLEAYSQNHSDELLISFNQNSSSGFNLHQDAYKFFSENPGSPELYTISTNKKLSIDVRPPGKTIQLGFKNEKAGIFSIGIKAISDIPLAFIEDTKSGNYHDLLSNPYEFIWNPDADNQNRFILHLKEVEIPPPDPNVTGIEIYAHGNCIYANSLETGKMQVFDMMSKIVLSKNLSEPGLHHFTVNLNDGVYIVRMESDSGIIETQLLFIE